MWVAITLAVLIVVTYLRYTDTDSGPTLTVSERLSKLEQAVSALEIALAPAIKHQTKSFSPFVNSNGKTPEGGAVRKMQNCPGCPECKPNGN